MIEEIKQALGRSTPGKWDVRQDKFFVNTECVSSNGFYIGGGFREQDAYLIANAPEWLRYLLGEVERTGEINKTIAKGAVKAAEDVLTLHAQVEELQKALEDISTHVGDITSTQFYYDAYIEVKQLAQKALERTKP